MCSKAFYKTLGAQGKNQKFGISFHPLSHTFHFCKWCNIRIPFYLQPTPTTLLYRVVSSNKMTLKFNFTLKVQLKFSNLKSSLEPSSFPKINFKTNRLKKAHTESQKGTIFSSQKYPHIMKIWHWEEKMQKKKVS